MKKQEPAFYIYFLLTLELAVIIHRRWKILHARHKLLLHLLHTLTMKE